MSKIKSPHKNQLKTAWSLLALAKNEGTEESVSLGIPFAALEVTHVISRNLHRWPYPGILRETFLAAVDQICDQKGCQGIGYAACTSAVMHLKAMKAPASVLRNDLAERLIMNSDKLNQLFFNSELVLDGLLTAFHNFGEDGKSDLANKAARKALNVVGAFLKTETPKHGSSTTGNIPHFNSGTHAAKLEMSVYQIAQAPYNLTPDLRDEATRLLALVKGIVPKRKNLDPISTTDFRKALGLGE